MIEEKNITMFELARIVMHHDAHAEQFLRAIKQTHAKIVSLWIEIEVAVHKWILKRQRLV